MSTHPNPTQSASSVNPCGNGHKQAWAPPPEGVGLESSMSVVHAGRQVLAVNLGQMLANEPGVVDGDDPEALHQMRVGTRRLQAGLRVFRSALGKKELQSFEKDVRWLATLLGRIRDLDIFMQWLAEYREQLAEQARPGVDRLVEERTTARARERAALLAGLHSQRYMDLKCGMAEFLQDSPVPADGGDEKSLYKFAVDKTARAVARVQAVRKGANLADLERLHRLRLESKRMRYTAEFFNGLATDDFDTLGRLSRKVQDALGRLHDANVHAEFLKDSRRALGGEPEMNQILKEMIRARRQDVKTSYKDFQRAYRPFSGKKVAKIIRRLQKLDSAQDVQ